MSNFFESLKGAASGLKSVATTYAKEIVNEIMDDEEHEGNETNTKDSNKESKSSQNNNNIDTTNFFASFIPENIKKVEPISTQGPKAESNPFKNVSAQNEKKIGKRQENSKVKKNDEESKGKSITQENIDNKKLENRVIEKSSTPINDTQHNNENKEELQVFQTKDKENQSKSTLILEVKQQSDNIGNNILDKNLTEQRINKLELINNKLIHIIQQWKYLQFSPQQNTLLNFDSIQMSSPTKEKSTDEDANQSPSKKSNIDSIELIEGAMQKFDKFWTEILDKYEKVVSSEMNPNVPDFEKLFKSLERPEKRHFKPFLKILAHSLQFLDKLQTQNTKIESLKSEIKTNALALETEKSKLLEKQILKLQNNCKDFIMSEETMKKQLNYMQDKNKELEEDIERYTNDISELK